MYATPSPVSLVGLEGTYLTEEASGGELVEPESSMDWNDNVAQPSPALFPFPFAAITASEKDTDPDPEAGDVHSNDQLR